MSHVVASRTKLVRRKMKKTLQDCFQPDFEVISPPTKQVEAEIKDESMLTKEEWKEYTGSIWEGYGWTNSYNQTKHPAVFPDEIPRRLIKMFSFKGETVLDPFCGVGTTLFEAEKLGRKAIGIDASKKYIGQIASTLSKADARLGDARDTGLPDESIQLVVFSPPYWDAIEYEAVPEEIDIGKKQPYRTYLAMMKQVGQEMHRILEPGRRMAIVIQDSHRGNREFAHHAYFTVMYEAIGFVLTGTWVWEKVSGRTAKPYGSYLRPYKIYPYVMNEYVLVFEKNGTE